MGSFTTNMYSHIALQTKGTTVYLTVKESYMFTGKINTYLMQKFKMQIVSHWKYKTYRKSHTGCIFTYVTAQDTRGISKPNPYMSTSKLVAQMDLQVQNIENHIKQLSLCNLKASRKFQKLDEHDLYPITNTTLVHANGNIKNFNLWHVLK